MLEQRLDAKSSTQDNNSPVPLQLADSQQILRSSTDSYQALTFADRRVSLWRRCFVDFSRHQAQKTLRTMLVQRWIEFAPIPSRCPNCFWLLICFIIFPPFPSMYSQKADMSLHGFYYLRYYLQHLLERVLMTYKKPHESALKTSCFEPIRSQNLQKSPVFFLGGGYKHV